MKTFLFLAIVGFHITTIAIAQQTKIPPKGWHLMDLQDSGYYGISLDKALSVTYGWQSYPVTVAIIGSSMDINHSSLYDRIWTNKKEISGNNKDDDGNGYIDDIHGWSFLGNDTSAFAFNVMPMPELIFVQFYANRFEKTDSLTLSAKEKIIYQQYQKAKCSISALKIDQEQFKMILEDTGRTILVADSIVNILKNKSFDRNLLDYKSIPDVFVKTVVLWMWEIAPYAKSFSEIRDIIKTRFLPNRKFTLKRIADNIERRTNLLYYPWSEIKNFDQQGYGSPITYNMISGLYTETSTAAAGIIAGKREVGGVSPNTDIMPIVISTGDYYGYRDRDLEKAIRYAVDNGARIIFVIPGKFLSPEPELVTKAIAYAKNRNVIVIQSAGSQQKDLDNESYFPISHLTKKAVKNTLLIGGSVSNLKNESPSTNYGNKSVDFFAPEQNIYTTLPGNKIGKARNFFLSGAVAVGVAALIWNYYPKLTYKQVIQCLEKSVIPDNTIITKPGTDEKVPFSSLSRCGGVVNAYRAMLEAESISKKQKSK